MKNREPHLKKPVCAAVHKVAAGDTLYKIARRYGVDYGRLMALNGITNPYNVKIGTEICIPPAAGTGAGSNCASYYVIREGDTLYGIARNFGIGLESLMSANSDIDPYNMHVGMRICIPPQRPDLQNPNGQRPNRPNAPGGPQSGSSRPPQSGTPGGQRPVPSHPSRPGTNGGQQPGSSRPSRPGTSGNQQSGGMQIMPRTEVSAGTASSDTQSSAASASGSAQTQNVSAAPAAAAQTGTAQSSGAAAQASTGSAVMDALNTANRKDRDTKLFGAAFLSDSERTSPVSAAAATGTSSAQQKKTGKTDAEAASASASKKAAPGTVAVFAEMTAENTTAAADTSAPDLQEVPSETTNLDSMTVSEPKAADSMVRPFVSDTMPDGILYRVEQGETLTDILKKFGICFSALDYSNASVDLSDDLTGLTLNIPYGDRFCIAPNNQRYVIRRNDDLDKLSIRFNISTDDLLRINPMKKPEDFSDIGSRINVSNDI